jgi:glyceraldehyde 3-phosphate dehydrogenase
MGDQKLVKIGINGMGRIGRAIFRRSMKVDEISISVINEINPDIHNIAYTLNYDTIYGSLEEKIEVDGDYLVTPNGERIEVVHSDEINKVDWQKYEVDCVVEATGVKANVVASSKLIADGQCGYVFVTHAPGADVDFTMVLAANHEQLDVSKHKIIATSICDATALAPVMECLDREVGIASGQVTTLHPWLSYQNLMDGASSSWSVPGDIYHHYALGRAAIGNLIPKPTSAITATTEVMSRVREEQIGSFSYRTPTAIVGSANLTLQMESDVTVDQVHETLQNFTDAQQWQILNLMNDPLVSLDFVNDKHSAVVDTRWTSIVGGNLLNLVLWYDNEAGYSLRVIDQIRYVFDQVRAA